MTERIKCPLCKKEDKVELVGYDIRVTNIYLEGDYSGVIVAVYACHRCKVFWDEAITEEMDMEDLEYEFFEHFADKPAKVPKGYVGLP